MLLHLGCRCLLGQAEQDVATRHHGEAIGIFANSATVRFATASREVTAAMAGHPLILTLQGTGAGAFWSREKQRSRDAGFPRNFRCKPFLRILLTCVG